MKTTFIATGDSFITRHIGEYGYDGYEDVCDLIDRHEVRFANLEMTFHNQEGYPAAASVNRERPVTADKFHANGTAFSLRIDKTFDLGA